MTLNIDWLAPEILYVRAELELYRAVMAKLRGDAPICQRVIYDGAREAYAEYLRALQSICDFIEAHGEPVGEVN